MVDPAERADRESADHARDRRGGGCRPAPGEGSGGLHPRTGRPPGTPPGGILDGTLATVALLRSPGLRTVCYGGLDRSHFDSALGAHAGLVQEPRPRVGVHRRPPLGYRRDRYGAVRSPARPRARPTPSPATARSPRTALIEMGRKHGRESWSAPSAPPAPAPAVHAELDPGACPTGVTVPDDVMDRLPLSPHEWHGTWNCTLRPEPLAPPVPSRPVEFGRFPAGRQTPRLAAASQPHRPEPAAFDDLAARYRAWRAEHPPILFAGKRPDGGPGAGGRRLSAADQLVVLLLKKRWSMTNAVLAEATGLSKSRIGATLWDATPALTALRHTASTGTLTVTTAHNLPRSPGTISRAHDRAKIKDLSFDSPLAGPPRRGNAPENCSSSNSGPSSFPDPHDQTAFTECGASHPCGGLRNDGADTGAATTHPLLASPHDGTEPHQTAPPNKITKSSYRIRQQSPPGRGGCQAAPPRPRPPPPLGFLGTTGFGLFVAVFGSRYALRRCNPEEDEGWRSCA